MIRTGTARLRNSEDGSTLPLIAFFAALCLTMILLVTAATSLYLARERLFAVADGSALAGAEAFRLADARIDDGVVHPRWDDARIRDTVDDYLAAAPDVSSAARLDRLTVVDASARSGAVHVTLSARWHPPMASLLVPDGIRISVTSSARPSFG